ncbi:sensor histidine kinase [Fischerella sp. PCC 9605]|uniref:sensor histidine kinase n=1 Tax=Fischerella sp. PCC 9605 TaxID=1173024 RepID=UPI000686F891|nr:ATP-binding protein [Fischerella sp. PCC 9605]
MKFKRRRWSLALKLTLTITTLVVTSVGCITLLSIQREQQTFRTELQQQAYLLLDTLEVVVRDPLYSLDADFVSDLVSALGQNEQLLASGYVYDAKGRIIADAFSQKEIYTTKIDPFGQRLVASDTTIFEWRSDQLIAGRSVLVGRQRLGAISIGLSTTTLQTKIASVRDRGLGVAVVAGTVGTLLALLFSRSITKPLQELVRVTQHIARGDLTKRIQIHTRDELSVLADAFNDMTTQLQQTLALLEKQNEELEMRVKERTEELSQALYNLQQTQAQLVQTEKMSSLGQLVAGVAHEINNPVSFIHGNLTHAYEYSQDLLRLLDLYKQHIPNPPLEIQKEIKAIDLDFLKEDLPKVLTSMEMGSQRICQIVLSLRNFSRLDEADFKVVDIHEGIDNTLMILQHRLRATHNLSAIEVIKEYSNLPQVECYAGQLNQVFMNILSNAIDALEKSFVNNYEQRTNDKKQMTNPQIRIRTELLENNWIAIRIADNGFGMSEETRSKIFDPFFTTKPVGKGTGLGLSISYQIVVDKHGGKFFCHSAPGLGAEFVIEIPIRQQSHEAV